MRDPDELVKALEEIVGCFKAAEVEGLHEAIQAEDGPNLSALYNRRLCFAQAAAEDVLASYHKAKEGEYRILKRGEIVRIGDQFKDSIEDTWHPVALDVGLKVGTKECPKGIHRRPIRKEQP